MGLVHLSYALTANMSDGFHNAFIASVFYFLFFIHLFYMIFYLDTCISVYDDVVAVAVAAVAAAIR